MPQNLIELSAKYKDCITSHMLVFFSKYLMLVYRLFRVVSLHSSGLVIDEFSTGYYTESGRAMLC